MGPNLQAVAEARGAAGHLLAVCRREPAIDSCSKEGEIPSAASVHGKVELRCGKRDRVNLGRCCRVSRSSPYVCVYFEGGEREGQRDVYKAGCVVH